MSGEVTSDALERASDAIRRAFSYARTDDSEGGCAFALIAIAESLTEIAWTLRSAIQDEEFHVYVGNTVEVRNVTGDDL